MKKIISLSESEIKALEEIIECNVIGNQDFIRDDYIDNKEEKERLKKLNYNLNNVLQKISGYRLED